MQCPDHYYWNPDLNHPALRLNWNPIRVYPGYGSSGRNKSNPKTGLNLNPKLLNVGLALLVSDTKDKIAWVPEELVSAPPIYKSQTV